MPILMADLRDVGEARCVRSFREGSMMMTRRVRGFCYWIGLDRAGVPMVL